MRNSELQIPSAATMKSVEDFRFDLESRGWSEFEGIMNPEFTARLRSDCLKWIRHCNRLQIESGVNEKGDETGHHTLGQHDSLDEFVDSIPLHRYIDTYFEGHPYILHAFNPVGGAPQARTYVHRIHRDARTFIAGFKLKLNMLVMLDDFAVENGATQFMEGSHRLDERPSEEYFDKYCRCVTGTRGTIVLFNSYLWHRGGFNSTMAHRVALTLSFSPPFIKPQLDYARMLGPDYAERIKPPTRQLLGYNSMTPISLREWYQPEATRFYKSNQG
jgi:hypothetical protein